MFTGPTLQAFADDDEPRARDEATALVNGNTEDGSGWVATAWRDQLFIGMPEIGEVGMVTYDTGKQTVPANSNDPAAPLNRWVGGSGAFGQALAVADAGDSDHHFDLFVGAPQWDTEKGAVFVFANARDPRDIDGATLRIRGATEGDQVGARIEVCDDLDGDGHPEYLVSAPWFQLPSPALIQNNPGGSAEAFVDAEIPDLAGAVFLVQSTLLLPALDAGGSVLIWQVARTWWGPEVGAGLGHALQCNRDASGDGVADLVLGAPFEGRELPEEGILGEAGAVYVLDGSTLPPDGPVLDAAWMRLGGPWERGWFGFSLAVMHANGEGPNALPDLMIGAPGADGGLGRVGLFLGDDYTTATPVSATDPTRRVLVKATFRPADDVAAGAHFGRWLAVGRLDAYRDEDDDGQIDPDDRDDLVIGAPDLREGRQHDAGRIWVYYGENRLTWSPENIVDFDPQDAVVVPNHAFQRVGSGMSVADLDRDGIDDVILPQRASY